MSATKAQRIGIWTIAIFMFVGTIGSFVAIVLANSNSQSDKERAQTAYAAYQEEMAEYQKKVDVQTAELSKVYYDTFNQYANRPAALDAASVTELKTSDMLLEPVMQLLLTRALLPTTLDGTRAVRFLMALLRETHSINHLPRHLVVLSRVC